MKENKCDCDNYEGEDFESEGREGRRKVSNEAWVSIRVPQESLDELDMLTQYLDAVDVEKLAEVVNLNKELQKAWEEKESAVSKAVDNEFGLVGEPLVYRPTTSVWDFAFVVFVLGVAFALGVLATVYLFMPFGWV